MKQILRLTAMMWREEKQWLLIGFAASLLALLSAIALLALSGWFITAAGLAGAAGAGLVFDFFRPSAGIRFFALFRTATRYGERIATHDATLRFLTALRGNLFASVAAKRVRSFRNSELLQRLTGDLDAIDGLYLRVLLPTVVAAAVLLLACAALFRSPPIVFAVIIVFLLAAVALFAAGRLSRKSSRRAAFGTEALRVRSIDLVHAHTDLLFSGGVPAQKKKLEKAARYLANATLRLASIETTVSSVLAALAAALTAAFVYLSARALEAGDIGGPGGLGNPGLDLGKVCGDGHARHRRASRARSVRAASAGRTRIRADRILGKTDRRPRFGTRGIFRACSREADACATHTGHNLPARC